MENKIYPHIIEKIEDWPINKFAIKRKEFVQLVNKTVEEYFVTFSEADLDQVIAKALHQEKQRIKTNSWKADPPNQMQFFRKLQKEYNENQLHSDKHQRNQETIFRLIKRYSEEIAGNFNVNTFAFVRKITTIFFHTLLLPFGFKSFSSLNKQKSRIREHLFIRGNLDVTRKLFKDHTVILLPTHSSNLDSIMIGYAVDLLAGLPAFSYGAGLNLFDSEFFAFFMNRLGAYKVDRRKKNQVYLQTLNYYSKLSVEDGVNTIFFPGGTRSRSGEVESRLKLGLLSSLIHAQRDLLEKGSNRKIIIVPLVLSYESVLEARSLILQHLRTSGQEKYTARERSSSIGQYFRFSQRFLACQSSIFLSFGDPIDVFGNAIGEDANSINAHSLAVNLKDYFLHEDKIVQDEQRESIYTKELGEILGVKYKYYNFILPSHLVAYAAFQLLSKIYPDQDIYGLVQIPEEEFVFPKQGFHQLCIQLQNIIMQKVADGQLIPQDQLKKDIDVLIKEGIEKLGVYHIKRVLKYDAFDRLISEDFIALLFYQNKLINLQLDAEIDWNVINLEHTEILDELP